jgi:cytoskeletal protein CcmA (bactofilin family)
MFTSKKESEKLNIDKTVNRISSGTVVRGDMESETDLRIDGKVTGNVVSKAKVIIGVNGELIGDLDCIEAAIEGKVKGNISIEGLLRLNSSSRVEGEVNYKKIIIEEGAVIIGNLVTQSAISVQINLDAHLTKSKDSTNKKLG